MDWVNYHHLRYFWTVAKEGSLARAAAKLHVSQPSISEQVRQLEESFGERLFRRVGRTNRLTDTGEIVFGYAEEIFSLGRELLNAVQQRPGGKTLRLYVGIVDSFPKVLVNEILRPVFTMPHAVHVICREGKLTDLLAQLGAHRLDLLLSDEPASSSTDFRTYNHLLGVSKLVFCAERQLATQLKRKFPKSLHAAPALLPAENTPLRRVLEAWFREQEIKPQVVVECEDLALMQVMAGEGRGFIAVPEAALAEAGRRYAFVPIGRARQCRVNFHAITGERRIHHPAASLITSHSKQSLSAR